MPDMIPVGNTIIPPDPMKGINSLSGIIGIQQQKQALQTGQYQQATAQADAQQAQQKNRELQAAQALSLQGAKSGAYTNPDGTFNRQKMADDITKVAPTYGQPVATQLLSQANEVVANQQAHQKLTMDRKTEIGNAFQALAADPALDNTKFIDAIETLRQQHPNDPEFSRMLTSMSTHMPGQADTKTLRKLAGNLAAAATGETQVKPSTVDVGGQIQPGATNRFTGEFTPAGEAIRKTLGPAEQPGYIARRASAQEAGAGSTGIDLKRAEEVGNLQQTSSANLELTKQIDRLSEDINSGKVAKMISETGNYFGLSSINQARSQLVKDLGQVRGAVAARAGSDAKAAEILEGYPTDTTPTQTTHAAMDYIRGTLRQNLARGELLKEYQKEDPQSVRGFASADNILTRNSNPLMHEYLALKPDERSGFYRRNFGSAKEAQAFKDQISVLKKHTKVFD